MPIPDVLLVVQVLAPLNQVVNLVVELSVLQLHESLVIEGVLIELLQSILVYGRRYLRLFLNQLSVFSILVEFPEPLQLFGTFFLCCQLHALFLVEVELLGLVRSPQLDWVIGGEDLVRNLSAINH